MIYHDNYYAPVSYTHLDVYKRQPLSLFDVPELLSRKKSKPKQAKNVRIFGRSIDERTDIVKLHLEIGHWEIDTIVGKRRCV